MVTNGMAIRGTRRDNIKINLAEIKFEFLNWFYVGQNRKE